MVESCAAVVIWENVWRHTCGFSELGRNGVQAECLVDEPTWVWLSAALNPRSAGVLSALGVQARARHERVKALENQASLSPRAPRGAGADGHGPLSAGPH